MKAHDLLIQLLGCDDPAEREGLRDQLEDILSKLESKLEQASYELTPIQTPHGRSNWINE